MVAAGTGGGGGHRGAVGRWRRQRTGRRRTGWRRRGHGAADRWRSRGRGVGGPVEEAGDGGVSWRRLGKEERRGGGGEADGGLVVVDRDGGQG